MLVENEFPADARVRNEAFTLNDNGYKVSVIALRHPNEKLHERLNGIAVYRIPRLTLFKKLPIGKSSLVGRLLNKVQVVGGYVTEYSYFTCACLFLSFYVALREGFDVIHAHNPPDTLALVAAVHKLFGKKFVFDHHDLSPELYLSRYNTTSGFVTRALMFFERLSVSLSDVVIATNESYKAVDVERNGISANNVFVVRNGPDLKRVKTVAPDQWLVGMGKTILGYVGVMNPQDGLDYLLRSLAYLAHDLKRTDFYCVLVGSGDSWEELRTQAATLGIADHVLFTGPIADEQLLRYLSTADICLDPNPSSPLNDVSTWIKVMEYMALGKPIVSFDLKETRVSAGEAAVFVEPNNVAAFATAIRQLMDDPERRSRMGEWGRARVNDALNWSVTSRSLLAAYDRLFPTAQPTSRLARQI
jgi:glycosyltransferase involved in cell wall biosynthesis